TFLALYVFPFAVIACVPAYLILRRYNQLRFRTCFIAGGAFGGAVATFGSLLSNGGLGAIVLFAVTGFATAAAAYQTLALLAMRRSPNNAFESGPPSAAAQRERYSALSDEKYSGYNLARMRFEILLAPEAVED